MNLPFLKSQKVAGLIIAKRKPDGGKEEMHEAGDENHALEACADDILRAISAKDSKGLAAAIRSAFELCESYPDEEAPQTDGSEDAV